MPLTLTYRLTLEPDDNDTVLVTSPDLPGLVTFGADEKEAVFWAHDAAAVLLDSMVRDGDPIPPSFEGHHDRPMVTVTV